MKKSVIKKILWSFVSVLWMTWTIYAAWLTGPVISDSWQSVGAAVGAKYPFDLKGLYLGDFDGFARTWGHHWPGWPLLWSMIFSWMPFHSMTVFSIETWIYLAITFVIYCIVWKASNSNWACVAIWLVAFNSAMHVSLSMMRPEIFTSFLCLLLVTSVWRSGKNQKLLLAVGVLACILPLIHVMGCVVPPALMVNYLISNRFSFRRCWFKPEKTIYLYVLIGWTLGVLLLSFWFLLDAERWHQFAQNLFAQRLSAHGWWNSFRACYLGDLSGGSMLLLSLLTAIFAFREMIREKKNQTILLYACIPLAVVIFSFVAKNPNRLQLACMVPCASVAVALGLHSISKHFFRPLWLVCMMSAMLIAFISTGFHVKRLWCFISQPISDSRSESQKLVNSFRNERKVFLPMSLWEAAANEQMESALFYTFPNVSTLEYRCAFEKSQWSKARSGDILIFDLTQEQGADKYFQAEAYVRWRSFDYRSIGTPLQTVVVHGVQSERKYQIIRVKKASLSF